MGILNTLAVTSSNYRSIGSSEESLDSLLDSISVSQDQGTAIWMIVSLILAIVGGLLIYFLFVKKKVNPANKFLVWLKNFLKFDKIIIEDVIKISYLIIAIFFTLSAFSVIGYGLLGFLTFLCVVIVGNLVIRVGYELTMIIIMIWSNTTKIKNKLTGEDQVNEKKAIKKENK